LAEKYTATKLAAFARQMFKSMGVRILFYVALRRLSGKIAVTYADYNDDLGGGASYLTKNPKYKETGITSADWMQHNLTYYKADPNGVASPVTGSQYQPKKPLIPLSCNPYGEPLLPDPSKGQQDRPHLQGLVRSFLARHYGELRL